MQGLFRFDIKKFAKIEGSFSLRFDIVDIATYDNEKAWYSAFIFVPGDLRLRKYTDPPHFSLKFFKGEKRFAAESPWRNLQTYGTVPIYVNGSKMGPRFGHFLNPCTAVSECLRRCSLNYATLTEVRAVGRT
jgi:hypothetical protein